MAFGAITALGGCRAHYGWVSVSIHWIVAILLLAAIYLDFSATGTDIHSGKLFLLRFHAVAELGAFLFTLIRIIWRLVLDKKPEIMPKTPKWRQIFAGIVHFLLVILPVIGATFGAIIAIQSGALPTLFLSDGIILPDFWEHPLRLPHSLFARLILLFALLHTVVALMRAFMKPKGSLTRIWFGSSEKQSDSQPH